MDFYRSLFDEFVCTFCARKLDCCLVLEENYGYAFCIESTSFLENLNPFGEAGIRKIRGKCLLSRIKINIRKTGFNYERTLPLFKSHQDPGEATSLIIVELEISRALEK